MANPNQFNSVLVKQPKRNPFNLSHENKLTAQWGRLTPVDVHEVVPGDTFTYRVNSLIRMQALVAPLMHRVDVYFHSFYVPNRLVWDKWEDFIVQDPENQTVPFPRFLFEKGSTFTTNRHIVSNCSNMDYFGLPTFANDGTDHSFQRSLKVNQLPFRAFVKIYNDYYRDENLEDEIDVMSKFSGDTRVAQNETNGGVESIAVLQPRYRAWEKDYFTSALPNTQLGDEVSLPIRGILEVAAFNSSGLLDDTSSNFVKSKYDLPEGENSSGAMIIQGSNTNGVEDYILSDSNRNELLPNMGVDLADSVKITVNELRKTVALQTWLERSFVGGTRYKESILAHFGVLVPDGRLQRPEYLGGGKAPIVVSPVVQNSATSDVSPQGNMAGYGMSVGSSTRWKAYFPEHGYVITLMSIMPKPNYMNTLDKMWQIENVMDFYWQEFAHLGEQEIKNSEIFSDPSVAESHDGESDEVFGYAPIYARYKFKNNEVHGEFKDTMKQWSLTREFGNQPTLSPSFIHCTGADFTSPFAVTGGKADYPFICQLYFDIKAYRPMPVYSTPRLIG